jgi:hypothetical protein
MMKYALAGLAMIASVNSAGAQQVLQTVGPCVADREEFEKTVASYGETIFSVSLGYVRILYQDQLFDQEAIVEVWVNEKTRTETISVFFTEDNTTCILVSATNWSIVE